MYRFHVPGSCSRQASLVAVILLPLVFGCDEDNTVGVPPADTIAPGDITNLAVIDHDHSSVTLVWRAPGDDGSSGTAEAYDLRYATEELTPEVWDRAHLAVAGPPGEGGSPDTTSVTGLARGVTYFFGLKVVDENHNWSPLSNVVSVATDFGGPYERLLAGVYARTPKWSPDGRRIAFGGSAEIWTIPAGGGEAVRITTGGGFHPCWSPDGTEIAFVSVRTGRTELWRIPAAGGTAVQITHGPPIVYFEHPDWSPDGELIAIDAFDGFYRDIWLVPLDGGDPEQWTDEPGNDSHPAWSPDGCRLAFRSSRPNSEYPWNIWIGCRDGSSTNPVAGSEWAREPAWSPDGNDLVFMQFHEVLYQREQLWRMPVAGGSWVQLTREDMGDFIEPDWSPDGTHIVCAHKALGPGVLELWTVSVK